MHPGDIPSTVRTFCEPLLPPAPDILVAVSGGSDSVALFHVLYRLRERLGIGRLGVAHVNHGLRGEESDGDERFVRAMARDAGAEIHVERLGGKRLGDTGLEQWARAGRYGFFARVREEAGYSVVATGHTADDQAETLLMRMMRGCGLRGMMGIHAMREDAVVRPLLRVRRAQLREWLVRRGLAWREDASNRDVSLGRNRVRHELIPAVEEQYPEAVSNMAELALSMQSQWKAIAPRINNWIDRFVVERGEGAFSVAVSAMCGESADVEACAQALRGLGVPFSRCHLEGLVRLCRRGRGQQLFPAGWRARICRGSAEFTRGIGLRGSGFRWDLQVPGQTRCGDVALLSVQRYEGVVGPEQVRADRMTAYVDAGESVERLVFRSVEMEDRFTPSGSSSAKSVHKFLKKQGVPRATRDRFGIVATEDGRVVWIPGFRVGRQFCVDGAGGPGVVRLSCKYLQDTCCILDTL
jgi:tRNA(Ile)-lysidine synthase